MVDLTVIVLHAAKWMRTRRSITHDVYRSKTIHPTLEQALSADKYKAAVLAEKLQHAARATVVGKTARGFLRERSLL